MTKARFRCIAKKYTMCLLRGHVSTGILLAQMCDHCHSHFEPAGPSVWVGDTKFTRSR
jgi:hypothetical protein